ncbi:MAG: DNA polymerase X family [uncultured Solirubrobacteraceae bacterium]|uniref:DNA polymerase X family n=1 Tax=uncultured Solirubrobacteraceae bacterium TaxID=1162706 RepID=A0A6J4RQR6_9ACTN|nr:MAG: DNA polymerase X family [uncultured Solirubrobacteraceae bacterium]
MPRGRRSGRRERPAGLVTAADGRLGDTAAVENAWIADRLEAFASLLDLGDANPYMPRAYRRAAETIRGAAVAVAGLVRSGQVRRLRGIGPGIESRLRELVETGEIAELAELERELSPELVGLGRYLGLGAARSLEIARALGVSTAGELRAAAAAGRLRTVPGIGPKREAQLLDALAREVEPRSPRGLLLGQAWELAGGIAAALGGEAAGDPRRWRDSCEHLAVVCAAPDPAPVLARFAALPQIVAVVEQAERRAVGVTVEGVPIELVAAEPQRFGTALVRATGSPAYVAGLGPLPDAPGEEAVYAALGLPWCPPELREEAFRGEVPALVSPADVRGDLHCHTTWSDGRASVEEMGRAARERGYDYIAICDHTPAVGAVRGLGPDDVRRQAEEIAAANDVLAPFRVLRGIECDILPDGRLDLPDDVLAELDWVQASVHGGQRMARREMTERVEAALRNPYVRCLSHPTGRIIGRRPENALDLERVYAVALEEGVALEVNGLAPRLDLSGEHVRDAIGAGVRIVCSTDAHSVRGLEGMELGVRTARRGGATAADVLNTGPLSAILRT